MNGKDQVLYEAVPSMTTGPGRRVGVGEDRSVPAPRRFCKRCYGRRCSRSTQNQTDGNPLLGGAVAT